MDEIGIIDSITGDNAPALKLGQVILKIDPRYFRPTEVETLGGSVELKINWIGCRNYCAKHVQRNDTSRFAGS